MECKNLTNQFQLKNAILKYCFETPRKLKYTRCDIKRLKTSAIQVCLEILFFSRSWFLEFWFMSPGFWDSYFQGNVPGSLFEVCRQKYYTMTSDKFGSQIDRKIRTWFFTFLNKYASWVKMGQNSNHTVFTSKIQVFCRPVWTKGGTPWKWFWQFSNKYKNKYCKQLKKNIAKEIKNGVICPVSVFLSELWSLHFPKLCIFLQIFAYCSKKSKSMKAI